MVFRVFFAFFLLGAADYEPDDLIGTDYSISRQQLIAGGWSPEKTAECEPLFICSEC